jgi:hypothetical protein
VRVSLPSRTLRILEDNDLARQAAARYQSRGRGGERQLEKKVAHRTMGGGMTFRSVEPGALRGVPAVVVVMRGKAPVAVLMPLRIFP